MSVEVSTEQQLMRISPLIQQAAQGDLPHWARVRAERREHIRRVVALLDEWARALDLSEEDRLRWRAAGWLHDSLRDAPPEDIRSFVPEDFRDLPPLLFHGPAAAARIEADVDQAIRDAVYYHTIGHPALDQLGKALYLADFLEPGRDFSREWRAELRERMPAEMEEVLIEVVAARIRHLLESRKAIRPETASFWSSLVESRG